jgi:polyvinyl alcohol dehydrogenase (cytochrome)
MLVKACKAGSCKQLVVAGQKSGWLWALNPDTGYVHWSLPVGPGGTVGGLQWGSAADNTRIYVANNNYLSVNTDLTVMKSVVNFPAVTNQRPPTATDGGLAAAIDAYTGELLWTFANPTLHWDGSGKHARSQAPMTVVNDVLFYPSE